MFWVHCGLFVLVIAVPGFISSADSTSKREADYTLDDSFWNEETPVGEVERLLREYRQNQELVRNIGAHYYQIIYPVQLRHHEKMGISTREVAVSKFPQRGYGENGYQNSRGRSKTGRHFHRTSLLIKAFNHKFRLDLELNAQLLAPNLVQKDFLSNGAEQSVKQQDIEHCYYHGTVRDYPGASAAFHTCNGVSGVIHLGNETFVIHPFYGGDLSFDKRNGSTRAEVVHDAIQVANIADLYFRTLNTRVSVTYIETWQSHNQADITKGMNIGAALSKLNDYTTRKLYHQTCDTIQLLTGETFQDGESGIAVPSTVCSKKSVGISVDLNTYEPHLLAGTMAHMIGHNIGMGHDDGRSKCVCRDWHGCIMAQSIVGLENVQPYKFSECSKADYIDALGAGFGMCLFNKPNEVEVTSCGNRVIDEGEQCDCGSIQECKEVDPCCDPITCKLKTEAQCATGPCCSQCKLLERGVVCRESTNECDLPEVCSGETGRCPVDVYKKNGNPCSNNGEVCYNGVCPALNLQCEQIWGYGGIAADEQCFQQFNSKGSINGHCGTDAAGHYVKCEAGNVRCGSLQCQDGGKQPVISGIDHATTIISIQSKEYECKSTTGKVEGSELPGMGLVRDGTACGDNLICINQNCTNLFPLLDKEKCPSNHGNNECSGNGVCTNENKCYCNPGWTGTDCSIEEDIPTFLPTTSSTQSSNKGSSNPKMEKKETPYDGTTSNLSTVAMVIILVGVVKGVFICFALMAVCYRRKSTVQKYDAPYTAKPQHKSYSLGSANHQAEDAALDNVRKFITFGPMPHCRDDKLHVKRPGVDEEDGGLGGGAMAEVERTLDGLNGYHENVIEALRNAATCHELTRTPLASGNLLDEDAIHKSLAECAYTDSYRKDMDGHDNMDNQDDDEDHERIQSCGTIRIRNLEDIIKQLERHTTRHISPCGSDEIRMSESETDRQYRIDSSVCSESSQGSRRCSRSRDDSYGTYRPPPSRSPYGTHHHTRHSHQMHEEEGIYETADPDRGSNTRGVTPDSESDAFIQAQQQLARWTNEDGIQHRPPQHRPPQQPPPPPPLPATTAATVLQQQQQQNQSKHCQWHQHPRSQQSQPQQQQQQQPQPQQLLPHQKEQQLPVEQLPIKQRGYYPSPPHTDNGLDNGETETAQSQQEKLPDVREIDVNHLPNINKCPLDDNFSLDCNINNGSPKELNTNNTSDNENTALLSPSQFPEYKH